MSKIKIERLFNILNDIATTITTGQKLVFCKNGHPFSRWKWQSPFLKNIISETESYEIPLFCNNKLCRDCVYFNANDNYNTCKFKKYFIAQFYKHKLTNKKVLKRYYTKTLIKLVKNNLSSIEISNNYPEFSLYPSEWIYKGNDIIIKSIINSCDITCSICNFNCIKSISSKKRMCALKYLMQEHVLLKALDEKTLTSHIQI